MATTDARALELISLGDKLWSDKRQYDSLCQELAWQFCPDLASFTTKLVLGQDFAVDRMDSFPEQISRELTNQLSAMLRPSDRPWFRTTTLSDSIDSNEDNARYLEYVTAAMRRALYDPRSKFIRATKEADRFYVNFGQAVLSCEEAPGTREHLYFRNYHIKDCSWLENDVGEVDTLHRKEMITARAMAMKFQQRSDRLSEEVKEAAEKTPHREFEMRIIVMPAKDYDLSGPASKRGRRKLPFTIVYVDAQNGRVIREGGLPDFIYIVPRWQMFAHFQYAFSPCSMVALPDARMSQMMAQILLEAGEKAIDPPLVAKQEVVIGEPNIQAGGISWIDIEHDDNLKNALDAIKLDPNMTVGFEMRKDLREMLSKAFYIDKLALPEPESRTTAYEIGRRLEEHVRNLLPLFEPMQIEYNTRILDKAYSTLANMRAFTVDGSRGAPPLPPELSGADVTWSFESPIQRAQDQILVEYFKGSLELAGLGLQAGAKANPLDVDRALRDAIRGIGTPATWRKTPQEMEQEAQQLAQMKQLQMLTGAIGQAADIGSKIGDAGQKLGLLPGASQKVVQGSAQGAPEAAGAAGLPASDVGDQGPPSNENQSTPQPWQPQHPAAVLQQELGFGQNAQGGQPGASSQQQPEQPAPTPLQPAAPSSVDMMRMMTRLASLMSELEYTLQQPKKIVIERDAKGRMTGAVASSQ